MRKVLMVLASLFSITVMIAQINVAVAWSSETPVITLPSYESHPSIAQMVDGRVWVACQSNIKVNIDIIYKIYDWSLGQWMDAHLLTNHTGNDIRPSLLQAANGTIWLFWSSDRRGNYDIFYKTSPDGDFSQSNEIQLTNSTNDDKAPSVVQAANGTIWVVWQRTFPGATYDLVCTTYNGTHWSSETPLNTDPNSKQVPSIAQMMDGNIWVAYSSYRAETESFDVFYTFYNGSSWSYGNPLINSTDNETSPSILQDRNGAIWAVWASARVGATTDLYYKTSSDDGVTWSDPDPLVSSPANDNYPSIAQINDKKIWLVFATDRNEETDSDIYYKTSSEIIDHDVTITSVTPSPTMVDPGENVSISVVTENQGNKNTTFVVKCSANFTVIGYKTVSLTPGNSITLTFVWNTSTVAGGTYTISATASCGATWVDTFTDGTVLVIFHDVAVTSISPSEPSVGQGHILKIYVEVRNKGILTETFNVTAYYDSTAFETQKVTGLDPNAAAELTFNWNTINVSLGYYVVSATAEPIPGETYLEDNSMTDGTIRVKIAGDVNSDGEVDIKDLVYIAHALGTNPQWPHGNDWGEWNPEADINNDLKCDVRDLYIASKNYGEVEG